MDNYLNLKRYYRKGKDTKLVIVVAFIYLCGNYLLIEIAIGNQKYAI